MLSPSLVAPQFIKVMFHGPSRGHWDRNFDGDTCEPYECDIGPGLQCKTCVEQQFRASEEDCATCNDGHYSFIPLHCPLLCPRPKPKGLLLGLFRFSSLQLPSWPLNRARRSKNCTWIRTRRDVLPTDARRVRGAHATPVSTRHSGLRLWTVRAVISRALPNSSLVLSTPRTGTKCCEVLEM